MRSDLVELDYTNHRGFRSTRTVLPVKIWFGNSKYHDGEQWFLKAYDDAKEATRDFAILDIHSWTPTQQATERGPGDYIPPAGMDEYGSLS